MGIDPLHRGDRGQHAAAAAGGHLELQPGDVACRGAGGIADHLADDGAAIAVLPARTGIVPADGLAVGDQGGDRLAKSPGQLAVGARLAFIDLRALGMEREDRGFAGGGDRFGEGRLGGGGARRKQKEEGCGPERRHCYASRGVPGLS
jgi:hypothetical protein